MDISKFDLQKLQILHHSFNSVLKSHEDQLKERLGKGDLSKIEESALIYKIENFKSDILLIENRIKDLNSQKLRFSVEYIFWNFGLPQKLFQVQFLTTSNSYKKFGSYVTGVALYNEDEIEDLVERSKNGKWNDGRIKFEEEVNQSMTKEQLKALREEGFLASEIDLISYI